MIYNLSFTLIYVAILLWIYQVEFTYYWTYMRFEGELDLAVLLTAFSLSALLALLLPVKVSARGYILVIAHYFFFVPSVIYLAFNAHHQDYLIALAVSVACVYLASAIPLPRLAAPRVGRSSFLVFLLALVAVALVLQVAFGGLTNFNLNPEAVYEFRRETAAAMPAIFGYIISNVANVLIPSLIALALYFRIRILAIAGLLASVALFGMSHHKLIVFVSLTVFGLYFFITRMRSLPKLALLPLALVSVCALEVFYFAYIAPEREVALITSYIVRRALLVPPMLDVAAVELFSEEARYYWSTSRFGLGLAANPHGVTAPFLLGIRYFDDPDTSANVGNIGSGYAHAGILGVVIYSLFTGLFISFVNSIGGRVGHPLAATLSVPLILVILTSTDLTTAILSHGLFLLFVLLMFLPRMNKFQYDEKRWVR